jgi:hypothetical protein
MNISSSGSHYPISTKVQDFKPRKYSVGPRKAEFENRCHEGLNCM